MQAEVVKLALDLLVREPDIEGFFGGLTKTMVEESESYTCAVWLLDEARTAVQPVDGLYGQDRLLHSTPKGVPPECEAEEQGHEDVPVREHGSATSSTTHPGWTANRSNTNVDDAAIAAPNPRVQPASGMRLHDRDTAAPRQRATLGG